MTNDSHLGRQDWKKHVVRAGTYRSCLVDEPKSEEHRGHIEPWLSALFQAEHLNLLVGSGLTTAIAALAESPEADMSPTSFQCDYAGAVKKAALASANRLGRKEPNIEDQIRVICELIGGLRILAGDSDEEGEPSPFPENTEQLLGGVAYYPGVGRGA